MKSFQRFLHDNGFVVTGYGIGRDTFLSVHWQAPKGEFYSTFARVVDYFANIDGDEKEVRWEQFSCVKFENETIRSDGSSYYVFVFHGIHLLLEEFPYADDSLRICDVGESFDPYGW